MTTTPLPNAIAERRWRVMGPAYRLFYDEPLHLDSGEGVWLTDVSGRRYLDMYNNVPHVGHCHPRVVAAVSQQLAQLNTHTRYLHDNVVSYAERLVDKMPPELSVAMFSCSGSEANELALRVARAATGASGVIVIEQAYHGTTQATFEISTEDNPRDEWPEHVVAVPAPDTYRGRYRGDQAAAQFAAHMQEAIETLASRGLRPAAFIIDTIASSSGVVAPPPGYLAQVAEIIRAAGGLFIADEVQPGLGRMGRHFWGFEADGCTPDIVTMGKPMGNGYPLAATVMRRPLIERFAEKYGYFNTFGGNPVAAAAGLAVLDIVEQDALQANALRVGHHLARELRALAQVHPLIGEVRGSGLFLAVELVTDRETRQPATLQARTLVNELRKRGVLTNTIGPDANILKLRPPLVFSRANADYFLQRLDDTLAGL